MAGKRSSSARSELDDLFLPMAAIEIPMLTSGEVIAAVQIKMSRLERFLENYPLKAGKPGQGQGTRRLFSPEDVRRLAITKRLLDDGFQPKLVAEILDEDLAEVRLIEYAEEGELYPVLYLKRDPQSNKRTHDVFWSGSKKALAIKDAYYVLDCEPLIAEVDRRIKEALEKRKGKK